MIYVTGDIHGDIKDLEQRKIQKLKKGDVLLVTGDFGFIWDNSKSELKNLKKLSKKKFTIAFVDGVHENFDMLNEYPECEIFGSTAKKISDNIYCLNRGEIYTIDNKKIFALGGGKDDTLDYDSYDPLTDKAMPTDEVLKVAVDKLNKIGKKIEIILTHEAPASVKKLIRRDSEINDINIFLDTLVHNVWYDKWYFGSLHTDRVLSNNMTCVYQEVIKLS